MIPNPSTTKGSSTRRAILATTGSMLATSGVIGAAGAGTMSPEEHYQRALEIRDRTGTQDDEAFENYLLNHGFEKIMHDTVTESRPTGRASDGVSVQEQEKSDFTVNLSCYRDFSGDHWADASFTAEENDLGDCGNEPNDQWSLQFEHSDYDLVWDSWYTSTYSHKRKAGAYGVAFYHEDFENSFGGDECDDGDSIGFRGYGGMQMTPESGTSQSDRGVYLNYYHIWSEGTIESVSLSSDGTFSVTISADAVTWNSTLQAFDEETDKSA